ncbi:MAG: anhydro-N-acetylmuramic acid kinase [Cytophagales bacterium]|nr:anhydro-N-acetylmuramic acid kinase [Cytophagales bacterium]
MNNSIDTTYNVVGLMSGTSLDGLDIVHCTFHLAGDGVVNFRLNACETVQYPPSWQEKLRAEDLTKMSGLELALADAELGCFMGEQAKRFLERHGLIADLVGSHGHTVFHQPEKALTVQIGSGAHLSAVCGIDVVSDFRRLDVALGGQGAPLVPAGEMLLLGKYDWWWNLGGICNLSWRSGEDIRACDITFCNMVMNRLALRKGMRFDDRGQLASKGKLIPDLFEILNKLDFIEKEEPKSLGFEWVSEKVFPLFDEKNCTEEDLLFTAVRHIASQIGRKAKAISGAGGKKMLATGGGSHNDFLMEQIARELGGHITVEKPDGQLADYKEAVIFALLGLLRKCGRVNVLGKATGSGIDHSGGSVFLAPVDLSNDTSAGI